MMDTYKRSMTATELMFCLTFHDVQDTPFQARYGLRTVTMTTRSTKYQMPRFLEKSYLN